MGLRRGSLNVTSKLAKVMVWKHFLERADQVGHLSEQSWKAGGDHQEGSGHLQHKGGTAKLRRKGHTGLTPNGVLRTALGGCPGQSIFSPLSLHNSWPFSTQ